MSAIFPPAILGPEMAAPIKRAPGIFWFFLLDNPHAHKIPPFRGGVWVSWKGGWKCQFEFFNGRGDFSKVFEFSKNLLSWSFSSKNSVLGQFSVKLTLPPSKMQVLFILSCLCVSDSWCCGFLLVKGAFARGQRNFIVLVDDLAILAGKWLAQVVWQAQRSCPGIADRMHVRTRKFLNNRW